MEALNAVSDLLGEKVSHFSKTIIPTGKRWYVYGHTEIAENGRKSPIYPIRKEISNWRSRTHILTAMTAADGSDLVYGLPLDLDYEDSDDRWKKRGKLDYRGIKAFIDETYPVLGRYLCTYTRSTRGKGLGLILFFDPFLRNHEKTGGVNRLAENVQRILIAVLNFHGIDCDTSASGIVRMTPNWRNNRILLHKDEMTIRRVQRDNEAHNVLRHVYNEMRRSAAFKSPTRIEAVKGGERFAVKSSADIGLGKIYAYILNSEPESLTLSTSYGELSKVSGLSEPTLRKYLSSAAWIHVTACYGIGLKVKLSPTADLSARSMGEGQAKEALPSRGTSSDEWNLPDPEDVPDGERNTYIWRKAVLLRNEGLSLDEAISSILELSKRIPGCRTSRNCRSVESITSSIYRHTRLGPKPKIKIFTLEALTKSQSYVRDLAPCEVTQESEENNGAEGTKEKHLDMVSTEEDIQPTPRQGGHGDLPHDSTPLENAKTDKVFLGWLKSIVPQALEKPAVTSPQIEVEPTPLFAACVIPMFEEDNHLGSPRRARSIREMRADNWRKIDTLERLEKALFRCQGDENLIVSVLIKEHEMIREAKRLRYRYLAAEGPFKRLCEAFSYLSEWMREEVLLLMKN